MITKIKITITENNSKSNSDNNCVTKKIHEHENIDNRDDQNTNNKQSRNDNFKMEVVSTIKWAEISKYACFHIVLKYYNIKIIKYIYFHVLISRKSTPL